MEGFAVGVTQRDALIAAALAAETRRQQNQLELIASENIVSRAVLDALGHEITNKTLEGYPGARFHAGGRHADVIERAAVERACELFDCAYANVQPHSGSQANLAVFFALLSPGDCVLSLDLAAGGHLSHGLRANLSGRWFEARHYGVSRDTGMIDYGEVEARILEVRPRLVIAGGSSYPRTLDFERLARAADKVDAHFMVDMAHIAGLVAGGVHPSPIPHADLVTCTTTKTLRGPRGGMILARDGTWSKNLQSAVFPGVQGSIHTQVIAAKAVCLGEALQPEFKDYARRVKNNAAKLAAVLAGAGIGVVTGGTDTHVVLLDLSTIGLRGQRAERLLERADITTNKNPIPFDVRNPAKWSGLRLGVAAVTTRGLGEAEMEQVGQVIASVLISDGSDGILAEAKRAVSELCQAFPIHADGRRVPGCE